MKQIIALRRRFKVADYLVVSEFMRSFGTAVFCLLTVSTASVLLAQSEGAVAQPCAVTIEPPPTGALGLEWRIQGDDNRNASVAVAWRRTGETASQQYMHLSPAALDAAIRLLDSGQTSSVGNNLEAAGTGSVTA